MLKEYDALVNFLDKTLKQKNAPQIVQQGVILDFHSGQGYLSLEFAFPNGNIVWNVDDKKITTLDAGWILLVLVCPTPSKVGVAIDVNIELS